MCRRLEDIFMKNNIRKERLEHKMTQKQLGMLTGVDQSLVSKYENGDRIPTTEFLVAMSDLYKVSIDYLLDRETI